MLSIFTERFGRYQDRSLFVIALSIQERDAEEIFIENIDITLAPIHMVENVYQFDEIGQSESGTQSVSNDDQGSSGMKSSVDPASEASALK